ncbi:MAG: hypothetical protein RLY46_1586 [Bacteroidota bacterium]|jgi:hypothetical protein
MYRFDLKGPKLIISGVNLFISSPKNLALQL